MTSLCAQCGSGDRFPSGACRPCQEIWADRQQTIPCSVCNATDRFRNGSCRACARRRATERRKPCPSCGSLTKLKSGHCIPCLAAKRTAPCEKCGGAEKYPDGTCATCQRMSIRAWRQKNPALRKAQKARAEARHPESVRRRRMRYLAKHPGVQNRWRSQTPGMGRAHGIVATAIRRGQLIRPDECEECGKVGRITAAHFDYSAPLNVRWLCRRCHALWDKAEPKSSYSRQVVQMGLC